MGGFLVTVAIPSLNQAEFLERAIESVCAQNVAVELMVVDGGSNDGSLAIIKRHANALAWWRSASDGGQASAINEVLARATGRWFLWLNADDLLLSDALAKVQPFLAGDCAPDVLYGDALFIDRNDRVIGAYPTTRFCPELLKSFCFISQPSCLVRTTRLRQIGGLDAGLNYALDYELWLRLLADGARFRYLPQWLSATRLHSDSKTSLGAEAFTREVLASQIRHFPDAAPVPRALWARYRRLHTGNRPKASALAFLLASIAQMKAPSHVLPASRWIVRVAALHVHAGWRGWVAKRALNKAG